NKSNVAGSSTPVITVGKASDGKNQLNLLLTTDPSQLLAGVDQRVAVAWHGQQHFVTPDSPVTLSFGTGLTPEHLGPPVPGVIHTDAGSAPAYVTTTYRFPAPGDYFLRASYKGQTADAPLPGIIAPSASQIPIAGARMISV